ncbi:hypothetical protein HAX54_012189 [Datura stramonium]|uniref:Uncharacterized protein n=1 Tax=Datura stramonium TaxID=4076 RepID=A0ABS8TKY0_DATST|nr:hypothetical protein [Datura stramonium]
MVILLPLWKTTDRHDGLVVAAPPPLQRSSFPSSSKFAAYFLVPPIQYKSHSIYSPKSSAPNSIAAVSISVPSSSSRLDTPRDEIRSTSSSNTNDVTRIPVEVVLGRKNDDFLLIGSSFLPREEHFEQMNMIVAT